jgi:hypothetical protein
LIDHFANMEVFIPLFYSFFSFLVSHNNRSKRYENLLH